MHRKAFTLSEVMLVLSVIGVIAALTIPGIMQNTQNKQTVSKLKKSYSNLSQAFGALVSDNEGEITGNIFTDAHSSADVINIFATKMNMLKVCGSGQGCFPDIMYKTLSGGSWTNVNTSGKGTAILADGTLLLFTKFAGDCSNNFGTGALENATCGYFGVDLNGATSPNTSGRDLFFFEVTKSGIFPGGSNNDNIGMYNWDCATTGNGYGCAAKVLQENTISY